MKPIFITTSNQTNLNSSKRIFKHQWIILFWLIFSHLNLHRCFFYSFVYAVLKTLRKIKQIIPRNRLNFVSLFFTIATFWVTLVCVVICVFSLPSFESVFDAIWCKMICSRPKLFLPCSVITFDYIVSIKHNLFLNKKKVFHKSKFSPVFERVGNWSKLYYRKERLVQIAKKRKLIPSRIFAECWECEPKNSHWFQGQPASQLEFSRIFCTDFTTYFS